MMNMAKMNELAEKNFGKDISYIDVNEYSEMLRGVLLKVKNKFKTLSDYKYLEHTAIKVSTVKENENYVWNVALTGDVKIVLTENTDENDLMKAFDLEVTDKSTIEEMLSLTEVLFKLMDTKVFCETFAEVDLDSINCDMYMLKDGKKGVKSFIA